MASADCTCCGMPTTVPEPVEIESEECDHGCFDCTDCYSCGFGNCCEVVVVQPVVLCDDCREDPCGTGAWHCDGRAGHSCDGTVCEG